MSPRWQFVLNGNQAVFYWHLSDYEAFRHARQKTETYYDKLKPRGPAIKSMRDLLTRLNAYEDTLNGAYEQALVYFQHQIELLSNDSM